jgi:SSS family solute:Na+ symporter
MPTPDGLTLSGVDLLVLAALAAGALGLAWRAARGRREGVADYVLAGRTLTLPAFVATLVPSFFGGTLGVGEYAWRYGVSNWLAQGAPYYLFAVLYAVWLVPRVRRGGGLTIADQLDAAYGRGAAVLGAVLVFLLASPADEFLMLGTLVHWASGRPLGACVAAVGALTVLTLWRGGLRADVGANRLEAVVMFLGFAVVLPFGLSAVGGFQGLAAALPASHLDWTGGQPPSALAGWWLIALWTFVDPGFHQRVLAAQDERTARVGILCSVALWALFDAMTTTAGLLARARLPELADPLSAYPALAEAVLPPVLKGVFLSGVAASTLAATASTTLLAAVSLGRDAAGRACGVGEDRQERWTKAALGASALLGVGLALALPSVVALWYTVGSCVIPGLLVPLVSATSQTLRVGPRAGLASSLAGVGAASAAWTLGSGLPFGWGLAASLAVWGPARFLTKGRPPSGG